MVPAGFTLWRFAETKECFVLSVRRSFSYTTGFTNGHPDHRQGQSGEVLQGDVVASAGLQKKPRGHPNNNMTPIEKKLIGRPKRGLLIIWQTDLSIKPTDPEYFQAYYANVIDLEA